jgi:hypothetical protein
MNWIAAKFVLLLNNEQKQKSTSCVQGPKRSGQTGQKLI